MCVRPDDKFGAQTKHIHGSFSNLVFVGRELVIVRRKGGRKKGEKGGKEEGFNLHFRFLPFFHPPFSSPFYQPGF
jgi:hypothetical protein